MGQVRLRALELSVLCLAASTRWRTSWLGGDKKLGCLVSVGLCDEDKAFSSVFDDLLDHRDIRRWTLPVVRKVQEEG